MSDRIIIKAADIDGTWKDKVFTIEPDLQGRRIIDVKLFYDSRIKEELDQLA